MGRFWGRGAGHQRSFWCVLHLRLVWVSSSCTFPGRQTTCLFQPFTTSSRAQVLGSTSFAQHQGTVGAALLTVVDGLPGRIAGAAGPGGNVIQSFSHPGWRHRSRSAGGWALDGVRLERVGKEGEGVELIVAVGCCLYGDMLRRVLLHWVDSLNPFKLRGMSLLMPTMVYLWPLMPLMLGLRVPGRVSRRSVLIIFELRVLGILLMFKGLSGTCNAEVTMSAGNCVLNYSSRHEQNEPRVSCGSCGCCDTEFDPVSSDTI